MNILDAVIITILIVGVLGGMSRGLIKQAVLLIGLVVCLIFAFSLRTPIATFMYEYLPFFKFGGLFSGVSIINILLYELIAFLIIFSLLYLVLRILLKITGIIEKILDMTIILGFFSKIGGGIVGFIEAYILVFVFLFVCNQPFIRVTGLDSSKVGNFILDKTPVMSGAIEDTRKAINEVYTLTTKYKNDKNKLNQETIKLFIKYDIITEENVQKLREKGKL
ncbi:MAG: CvpA family protein [Mollicutes bacterium]|nr:CvpA family protein [Mollicutes bacterium]